jgi:hypothetical protein
MGRRHAAALTAAVVAAVAGCASGDAGEARRTERCLKTYS